MASELQKYPWTLGRFALVTGVCTGVYCVGIRRDKSELTPIHYAALHWCTTTYIEAWGHLGRLEMKLSCDRFKQVQRMRERLVSSPGFDILLRPLFAKYLHYRSTGLIYLHMLDNIPNSVGEIRRCSRLDSAGAHTYPSSFFFKHLFYTGPEAVDFVMNDEHRSYLRLICTLRDGHLSVIEGSPRDVRETLSFSKRTSRSIFQDLVKGHAFDRWKECPISREVQCAVEGHCLRANGRDRAIHIKENAGDLMALLPRLSCFLDSSATSEVFNREAVNACPVPCYTPGIWAGGSYVGLNVEVEKPVDFFKSLNELQKGIEEEEEVHVQWRRFVLDPWGAQYKFRRLGVERKKGEEEEGEGWKDTSQDFSFEEGSWYEMKVSRIVDQKQRAILPTISRKKILDLIFQKREGDEEDEDEDDEKVEQRRRKLEEERQRKQELEDGRPAEEFTFVVKVVGMQGVTPIVELDPEEVPVKLWAKKKEEKPDEVEMDI